MHRPIAIVVLNFRSNEEKKSEICSIVWEKKWDDNYDKDNCDLSPYKL